MCYLTGDGKSLASSYSFLVSSTGIYKKTHYSISTLILLKLKLFIHIIQDALMIFAYPYPEQTGVNKLLFFTPRKTGTAFQMI